MITNRTPFVTALLLLMAFVFASVNALAQDDEVAEEEEAETEVVAKPDAMYIPLLPPFVVNYGGAGRRKYLKAEKTVRVHSIDAAQRVRHHMPAIRDKLVSLLSAQEELVIDTQEGKEQMRQDALLQIRQVIEAEEGTDSGVVDVFFDNLVVQR